MIYKMGLSANAWWIQALLFTRSKLLQKYEIKFLLLYSVLIRIIFFVSPWFCYWNCLEKSIHNTDIGETSSSFYRMFHTCSNLKFLLSWKINYNYLKFWISLIDSQKGFEFDQLRYNTWDIEMGNCNIHSTFMVCLYIS
jgi:hypothetical protein